MSELSRSYYRSALISSCAVIALAWTLVPAQAQTQVADAAAAPGASSSGGGQELEEIVVTAERRTTNIQKTALAISAVSADTLQKSNITQLADINGIVPSLEITKSAGFETVVSIRGVGLETPENSLTTVPGVSLFIDGVYIANSISLDQTLFDLDRVEVLRGPQGALYGQSSTGGAITLITRQPVLGEFSGSGDLSFGNYNLHRERAELNIPITETLAVRLSAQEYAHDGFTKDTSFPDFYLDDAGDTSGKIAILWKPTDDFSATLTEQFYSADMNGAAQKNINDPNPDPRVVTQDYPSKFNLDSNLAHLNLQWDLPWFTIKSVSAYQYLDHRQQEDSSRSAVSILGTYDDVAAWTTKLQNYNQEFDILSNGDTNLDWIAGAFLLSQKSRQFVAEFEGKGPPPNLSVPPEIQVNPPANLAYGNNSLVDRQSYSGFVQGTYHVMDNLRVTLGARYNYDHYKDNSHNFSAFGINTVVHSFTGHEPTWRGEVEYDLTPDNMIYASASRGYKPGGVNGIASAVVVPDTFKPERNTAFEIGSKNSFLDNTLRANLAAFYYIYKNQQYIETDPVPFDGGIANIPSTHVWGGEAEVSYVAMEQRLRVDANLSLEDGEIQGNYKTIDSTVQNAIESQGFPSPCAFGGAYYNPGCWAAVIAAAKNVGGNQPAKMPNVAGSLAISYAFSIPTGTLTPRVQYIYRGSFWARIFNEPVLDKVPSYSLSTSIWNMCRTTATSWCRSR
jgi:iron complex outermembrane receptor protein